MLINGSAILLLPLADWQLLTSKRIQESLPIFNGSLCQKKCCIVESREDALSGQLTPTYHLLASTCWFEGVQNLVAPRHVLCVCIYIYVICMCACTCCVCVCVYMTWYVSHHSLWFLHRWSLFNLETLKENHSNWNLQISWGSVSLCFCRLDGFTVSFFF